MAGPSAMFPNMTVELSDLSGLKDIPGIELLVFTNHNISNLQEIAHMQQLQSLFVFSNKLDTLEGVWQSMIMQFENELKVQCKKG